MTMHPQQRSCLEWKGLIDDGLSDIGEETVASFMYCPPCTFSLQLGTRPGEELSISKLLKVVEHQNSIEGELRLICDLGCELDPHSGILLDSWSLSAFIGASALQWEGWVEGTLGEGKTCKKQSDNSILTLLSSKYELFQNEFKVEERDGIKTTTSVIF